MLVSYSSITLYAIVHNLYALQYLRASLTVPLFFERQIRKDSNFFDMLDGIDHKIRNRIWCTCSLQTASFFTGFSITIVKSLNWVKSLTGKWSADDIVDWTLGYDW